jgi:nicotinamidase-related amidase
MSKDQGVWTYEDSALVLIDYQKEMFESIRSETSTDLIDLNVRLLVKAAKAFNMPVVLSTVGVEMGVNGPTRPSILSELPGIQVIDRSSMDAWEDHAFREAINKTGRKRLIFGALFTEICLAFPVIDASRMDTTSRSWWTPSGACHNWRTARRSNAFLTPAPSQIPRSRSSPSSSVTGRRL